MSTESMGTVLVVYENSDIDSVVQHLSESMMNPCSSDFISSVYIEEAIGKKFIEKLQGRVKSHKHSIDPREEHQIAQNYTCARKIILGLTMNTLKLNGDEEALDLCPLLVFDFYHRDIEGSIKACGLIVIFHTFRHDAELLQLMEREDPSLMEQVSIWQSNYGRAYRVALSTKECKFYLINCYGKGINMELLRSIDCNKVCVENDYHYECILSQNTKKSIVFSINGYRK